MYRDGVGDGQLQAVMEYELPQVQGIFPQVQENYKSVVICLTNIAPKFIFLL